MAGGFVYILQSISNEKLYTGACTNIDKRVFEHNHGKTKSTKNKGPWILKFKQEYKSLQEAKSIEHKLKKLKRKDYLEQIIKDGYIKITGCSAVG